MFLIMKIFMKIYYLFNILYYYLNYYNFYLLINFIYKKNWLTSQQKSTQVQTTKQMTFF